MSLSDDFFAAGAPVPRDVTLPDGAVHKLHFRQLTSAQYHKVVAEARAKGGNDQVTRALIVATLCTPEGEPVLTDDRAAALKPVAERALADAALEVNGMLDAGKR